MILRFLFVFLFLPHYFLAQETAIGEWQYHLSFTSNYQITQNDNRFFLATPSGIFTIEKGSNEMAKFDRTNAISDVGISLLTYDPQTEILMVGYTNGNIDLIKDGLTDNINDIKRSSSINGSKQINDALFYDQWIYVATGYGISVINIEKLEIKETIFLGNDATESSVFQLDIINDTLFAATELGLFYISINDPFITNVDVWNKFDNFPNNESEGPISKVTIHNDELFAVYRNESSGNNDVVYRLEGNQWTPILTGFSINSLESNDIGLMTCTNYTGFLLNRTGQTIRSIYNLYDAFFTPYDAEVDADTNMWIANSRFGVIKSETDTSIFMYPEGPRKDLAWKMELYFGELWIAGGSVNDTYGKSFNSSGFYTKRETNWKNYSNENKEEPFENFDFIDFIAVAVNQNDPEHVFIGSFGSGLIELRDQEIINAWNADNIDETSLQLGSYANFDDFVGIAGLTFDVNDNLWITNSNTDRPISVYTADGEWQNFSFGSALGGNFIMSDIISSVYSNQKWIVRFRDGLLVFDDNGTPTDLTDDQYTTITTEVGKGNLPTTNVRSIAEDLDGEIWVGTESGPCVFYSPGNIFSGNNFDANQILIEQGGNVQILLGNETITAIAIDGGNRKWMGTVDSGVYLLSPDGIDEIHHFTKENSPLLSNKINDITIDYLTGEVYFATSGGLVSFRSDATAEPQTVDQLNVFPNPVRNDYYGPIAIDGAAANSSVKITDGSGNVVNQLVSKGGQAIWDGTDFNGNRVSTGVYFILAVDNTGQKSATGKVLILN